MRFALLSLLLTATVTTPATAATATAAAAGQQPVAKTGMMLRDAQNTRLGAVEEVRADGSVGLIYASHYVVVPANTLDVVDGKLVTKLTKQEVAKLD